MVLDNLHVMQIRTVLLLSSNSTPVSRNPRHTCCAASAQHAQPKSQLRRSGVAALAQRCRSCARWWFSGGWRARRAQPKSCDWVFSKQTASWKKILIQPHSHSCFKPDLLTRLGKDFDFSHFCAAATPLRHRGDTAVAQRRSRSETFTAGYIPV